jgi:putative zinc finger/helix-turn-helix YgiT family protein
MKCSRCGGSLSVSRENYDYSSCGLPVTLCNMQVRGCHQCGERGAAIPNIEGLHRAIAVCLIRKPARFTGAEVRFLRKSLGWSGADFARHIGVSPEIVSKWENDRERIGTANDRLLRLLVANCEPVAHYPVEEFERIADDAKPAYMRAVVKNRSDWSATAQTAA